MVHDFMGKLDMQGTGLVVAEIILMFQYVACRINNIPYGIKNIHTYSEEKIENLRQGDELIMFISPADWMLFQAPNGLDFRSIENTRGKAIRSTMDKLDAMEEFRKEEIFELLNKQYANVQLQEPKEVRENSIVLVRNIGNEPKREPLKLARIEKIHASRDNAQRVVTLTYNNVRVNKDGEWIGTPIQVERSINDLVLVDNALSDSMLNPRISKVKDNNRDEQGKEVKVDDDKKLGKGEKENENDTENHEMQEVNETNDDMDGNEVTNEEIKVRKFSRIRKQRMMINNDEIGDCDDKKDPDYTS